MLPLLWWIKIFIFNILRSYDVSYIFKMAAVRILNFEKFKFWINFRGRSQNLRLHTNFGQNRMIGSRDIAIKPKSNMAAAAMLNLNLLNWIYFRFTFWYIFTIRNTKCVRTPNFVQIGYYFAKLWRFVYFQDGCRPPSWILQNSNFE